MAGVPPTVVEKRLQSHEGPAPVDQFTNSPTQGVLTRCGDQEYVPYKSASGTPNANVDRKSKRW